MANVDPEHWFLPAEATPRTPAYLPGNAVQALIDGQAYMADLQRVLEACDRELLIAGWEFSSDQRLEPSLAPDGTLQGRSIVDAVCAVARRGVDVKALVFCVPTAALPGPFQVKHAPGNLAFARAVNEAGGDAVLDARVSAAPTISSHHQKFIVAVAHSPADTTAFIGGIDIAIDRWDTARHESPRERQTSWVAAWHDVQARVKGPIVEQLWLAFKGRWSDPRPANIWPAFEEFRGHSALSSAPPACPATGSQAVQLNMTLPAGMFPEAGGAGEHTVARAHIRAIERAEHIIYIEDQYVWPCELVEPLEAALRRGVHVLLVVAREDINRAVAHVGNRLRHEVVERLKAAGGDRLHIFHLEQPGGEQIYVHSKVMIVDDCYAAIGSANFNGRSMTNDTEMEIGIVDADLVDITIGGKPERVCRFAHDLRCRLWAEHFELDPALLRDPVLALGHIWQATTDNPGRRAKAHHVRIGMFDIDPVAECITTLIMTKLVRFPIDLPEGVVERNAVKNVVNVALRGPASALIVKVLEEALNPDLAPALNMLGRPVHAAWRSLWAMRASHALGFAGRHSPVSEGDLTGQEFVESRNGVQIFRLRDGRYHVVSHLAVPSLEAARAAAIAVSSDMG